MTFEKWWNDNVKNKLTMIPEDLIEAIKELTEESWEVGYAIGNNEGYDLGCSIGHTKGYSDALDHCEKYRQLKY